MQIHIADFVEKYSAPLRHFQQSHLALKRSRKCARFVPEKLRLQKLAPEAGTVQIDKWLVRSLALIVQPFGQHALARAGFARDQDWTMAQTYSLRLFRHLPDGCARAEKRIDALSYFARFPRELFLKVALILERPFQHHSNCSHFHRLG